MNQPVNVEERNQHSLDIGLHLLPELSPPSWDATHTAGRRSLRGCGSKCRKILASGYASTLAQSCHLPCLVATSLRIIASPPKKNSPGVKWSVLVQYINRHPCRNCWHSRDLSYVLHTCHPNNRGRASINIQ
jgi:hypothetical protein